MRGGSFFPVGTHTFPSPCGRGRAPPVGNYPFSLSAGFHIGQHAPDRCRLLMADEIIKQLDPDPATLIGKDTIAAIDPLLRDPRTSRLLLSFVGAFRVA